MPRGDVPLGRAVLELIGIALVLWVAFMIGAVVIQIVLGLAALAGLGYLIWTFFFARK